MPSLEKYTNLEKLWLGRNNIGNEGCRSIANLLRKESSSLRYLDLENNDIGDEEAEILANSLEHNTTLVDLSLGENKFKEKGCRAFLSLLNDVSSIERTYNSNHTLITLHLPSFASSNYAKLEKHIASAIKTNRENRGISDGAGRAKVIETQLNSDARMELCHLQGIDYSYGSLFVEVDPILLPDVLALVGDKYGQNELYRMLISTAPDLASIVNEKVALKERMAEKTARIAAINAGWRQTAALIHDNLQMNEELASIESGEGHKLSGKKRGR